MTSRVVKLTVVTDFSCICCCIGQHELLSAISHCKNVLQLPLQFEIEHMPFRLISTNVLPENGPGFPKLEFMSKQIGRDQFLAFQTNVEKWAEERQVPLSFAGVINQTTRAHRLVLKAQRLGGQRLATPLTSAIFKATMQDGLDIADTNVLADLAQSCGAMSKADAITFLQSNELEKEVEDLASIAREKGVTGVPITIIDGKWAVSGGQSADVYIQIFKKLASCTNANHCLPSHFPSPNPTLEVCNPQI